MNNQIKNGFTTKSKVGLGGAWGGGEMRRGKKRKDKTIENERDGDEGEYHKYQYEAASGDENEDEDEDEDGNKQGRRGRLSGSPKSGFPVEGPQSVISY